MFGSIKLFTVRGIPIRAHFTALLLVALLVADMGAFGVPAGLLLMLSILLHELGHALMGRRFGVQTRSIDLHILGGTAFMQELPKKPRHEILIALAGPAVSAALAGLGALGLALTSARLSFGGASWSGVLSFFTAMNLSMTLFNLIPALPMDGGRVLRAALALRMGPLNATRVAVSLARAIAVVFIVGGIYIGALTLPLIGIMVFSAAGAEMRMAQAREMRRQQEELLQRFGFGLRAAPAGAFGGAGPVIDVTPGRSVEIVAEPPRAGWRWPR